MATTKAKMQRAVEIGWRGLLEAAETAYSHANLQLENATIDLQEFGDVPELVEIHKQAEAMARATREALVTVVLSTAALDAGETDGEPPRAGVAMLRDRLLVVERTPAGSVVARVMTGEMPAWLSRSA
jgi:hypothetical protein